MSINNREENKSLYCRSLRLIPDKERSRMGDKAEETDSLIPFLDEEEREVTSSRNDG